MHVGATDVVCEIETPRGDFLGIATEEALVTDQIRRYLFRDLPDDYFCGQRTFLVGCAASAIIGIKPRRV